MWWRASLPASKGGILAVSPGTRSRDAGRHESWEVPYSLRTCSPAMDWARETLSHVGQSFVCVQTEASWAATVREPRAGAPNRSRRRLSAPFPDGPRWRRLTSAATRAGGFMERLARRGHDTFVRRRLGGLPGVITGSVTAAAHTRAQAWGKRPSPARVIA
jgi:hypothetical protein